jgi:hypothetical protein
VAKDGTGTPPNNSGVSNVLDNTWHHVAWVWDKPNKTLKVYLDGLEALSSASTQSGANLDILPSASAVAAIGRKADNNRYFSGLMDELWIVGDALTPDQINTLRTQNIAVPEPSCLCLAAIAVCGLLVKRRH